MTLRLQHSRARHSVRAALRLTQPLSCLRRAGDCACCLVAFLLLFGWQKGGAQTAEEFFNGGAQFFISNNIPAALNRVESGRKQFPDDVKLKKLEELLKQQNQQQQQQQKQQNQSQQDQQQQQNQQAEKQSNPDNNRQSQDEKQSAKPSDQSKEEKEDRKDPSQASKPREMSPEEAKRLLDAQKGDEQILQLKPQKPPETHNKPIKDW
jgi:hypothetical protein